MLIGITGTIGVGKNTVADMLSVATDAYVVGFADELKADVHDWLARRIGRALTANEIEGLKGTCLGPIYQGYGELMRQVAGRDYWIKRLEAILPGRAIVADCRYVNEGEWVKSRGGLLVSVVGPNRRTGDTRSSSHPSETEVAEVRKLAGVEIANISESLIALRAQVAGALAFAEQQYGWSVTP